MTTRARARRSLEAITALTGTAKVEAKAAVQSCRSVADDLEASADLRAQANVLRGELEAPPTQETQLDGKK